jgi:hypothetical protein
MVLVVIARFKYVKSGRLNVKVKGRVATMIIPISHKSPNDIIMHRVVVLHNPFSLIAVSARSEA